MIPTFHCAQFLHQTLESVLSQDPGPDVMQIEVIDDWLFSLNRIIGSFQEPNLQMITPMAEGKVSIFFFF